MAYLGIDVDRVGTLSERLRAAAVTADDAQHYLAQAELLADIPVACSAPLDEIATDFNLMAERIEWAADRIQSFRLTFAQMFRWPDVPQPVRTPIPVLGATPLPSSDPAETVAPQWDAVPGRPWNQVHQVSSHNSYEVPGGIAVLFDQGVRSFELDVHRRSPADLLSPFVPGAANPWLRSHDTTASDTRPQWHVYHESGLSFTEYDALRDGLAAVASLQTTDPLTVFIDIKDGFAGAHSFDAFDQVLADELGARLYSPAAFQSRANGIGTGPSEAMLLDTVRSVGWPDMDELSGRVIVVLTDEIDGYARPAAQAFVAPPPEFEQTASGVVRHVPHPDALFYNANDRSVGPAEIAAVHASGTILRTYFNPRCETTLLGQASSNPHYRAVDVTEDDPPCQTQILAPPVPGPGPA